VAGVARIAWQRLPSRFGFAIGAWRPCTQAIHHS
jgi:hypothetical protein